MSACRSVEDCYLEKNYSPVEFRAGSCKLTGSCSLHLFEQSCPVN